MLARQAFWHAVVSSRCRAGEDDCEGEGATSASTMPFI